MLRCVIIDNEQDGRDVLSLLVWRECSAGSLVSEKLASLRLEFTFLTLPGIPVRKISSSSLISDYLLGIMSPKTENMTQL